MDAKELVIDMIKDYCEVNYDDDKNKTLKHVGLDSLDQLELAYYIGDKLDLQKEMPENLTLEQIVSFIEENKGVKIIGNI